MIEYHETSYNGLPCIGCCYCDMFLKWGDLYKHFEIHDKFTFCCHLCPDNFISKDLYKQHLQVHVDEKLP